LRRVSNPVGRKLAYRARDTSDRAHSARHSPRPTGLTRRTVGVYNGASLKGVSLRGDLS
jgi:hypothetical protein